jgi:hypothetical protein
VATKRFSSEVQATKVAPLKVSPLPLPEQDNPLEIENSEETNTLEGLLDCNNAESKEPVPEEDKNNEKSQPLSPLNENTILQEQNGVTKESRRAYRRRIRRGNRTAPPPSNATDNKPTTKTETQTTEPANRPTQNKTTKVIECGGEGNCQLLSFLEGLKRLHPTRATKENGKDSLTYTHLELRQMVVDFTKQQINSGGQHADTVLGYLDLDRKEYNENLVNTLKNEWNQGKLELEKDLKDKKITLEVFNEKRKALFVLIKKKAVELKTHSISKNEADFLSRLEKNGFSCASLHLFALSYLFEVPIKVKEEGGIPRHDVQEFNPTESKLSPIHLYRVDKGHYQLLIYPD